MKTYPAIEVRGGSPDLILASIDDFGPTAAEERGPLLRVFFADARSRDEAGAALAATCEVISIDVPDEDWARRSQENLHPVTVGHITIFPKSDNASSDFRWSRWTGANPDAGSDLKSPARHPIGIVIQPSMGFGTGHHATTRLCLEALQATVVAGKIVLDVGTGSGVLAMAAARLGAARVLGIDNDTDALQSARDNLALNPEARGITFDRVDLDDRTTRLLPADIVMANLTAALLTRAAPFLLAAVRCPGVLIASGLLAAERDEVCHAFAPAAVAWEKQEDEWVGLVLRRM